MRKMKKVLSVLATVVMVAAALTACGGNGKSGSATDKKDTNGDGKVKVGIVSMIENGAFMDMKEGIVAELKAQGYEDSQIDYKCAAGDASALSTIVTNMTDGTYDMIFSIATPQKQIHLFSSVQYQRQQQQVYLQIWISRTRMQQEHLMQFRFQKLLIWHRLQHLLRKSVLFTAVMKITQQTQLSSAKNI